MTIKLRLLDWIAAVFGARGAADQPRPLFSTWRARARRRQLAHARRKVEEDRRRRLAMLAADPARRRYAALIERGEAWSDAQIDYDQDSRRLATCVHLQPIERALRAAGITVKLLVGPRVGADCRVDDGALGRRFALAGSVSYAEPAVHGRSFEDPPAALIECTACGSAIRVVHRLASTPETPIFPATAVRQD